MQGLIVSDHEPRANHVRALLAGHGLEFPPHSIVPVALAADRAGRLMTELVVVVLSPDADAALEAVREVVRTVQAFVLVIGPGSDPQLIRRAFEEGANSYVDESQLETELADALDRFMSREVNKCEAQEAGRVVAVLGPSGGCGTSTLAANIAGALATRHGSTGLVDLRKPVGDLASLLDVQPLYTLADLCEHLGRLDQTMFTQFLARHESGVHLLAAPHQPADAAKLTAKGIRQALLLARRRFSHVVMDLDNAFDPEQVEALWQANVILVVLRLDYTSLRNARLAMQNLKEIGLGLDRVRLVVNRYGERKQLRVSEAEKALEMRVMYFVPNDPARVNLATNGGVPVVLQRPSATVSRRMAELAVSVGVTK